MFVNALMISAIYHQDIAPVNAYAAMSGSRVTRFSSRPETFEVDSAVLTDGRNALVALGGTTNNFQWAAHAGSAFFPAVDLTLICPVVGSFYVGEGIVEPAIIQALEGAIRGEVIITGHSMGGAGALILARHLAVGTPFPAFISEMTFGEPKTYGLPSVLPTIAPHLRIVAGTGFVVTRQIDTEIDPVSLSPPPGLMFCAYGRVINIAATILQIRWKRLGTRYFLNFNQVTRGEERTVPFTLVPRVDDYEFLQSLGFFGLHFMDSSYLPKCLAAWRRSGLNPELQALVPFAESYITAPFLPPDKLSPPVANSAIEQGFGLAAGTVTDLNRQQFSTISATAEFLFNPPTGGNSMPATPYVQPTFKGTFFLDQSEGGSSESFFAAPNNPLQPPSPVSGALRQPMPPCAKPCSTLLRCA